MPCCCLGPSAGADKKNSNKNVNANPPGIQSMKDRGGGGGGPSNNEFEEDKNAVAWLRTRSLENMNMQIKPQNEHHPRDGPHDSSAIFERQKERMQNRNPLEKPYELYEREVPLRPQDGNVLVVRPSDSSSTLKMSNAAVAGTPEKKINQQQGKHDSTPSTVASSLPDMEVFEPQESPAHEHEQREQQAPSEERNRVQVVDTVGSDDDSGEQYVKPGQSNRVYTISIPPEEGKTLNRKSSRSSNSASKFNAGNFVEVGGLMIPQTTQGISTREKNSDDSDHLSDVPSDVDSVTKERYLLACQILKTTLIEKEKSLIPIEREYILSLLGDYEKADADTASMVSEDHVSAIETAALRLEQDPLFQDPVHPSISAAAEVSGKASSISLDQKRSIDQLSSITLGESQKTTRAVERIPKHRHTATKPRLSPFGMCQPSSLSDAGVKVDTRKKGSNTTRSTFEVLLQDDDNSDGQDDSSTVVNKKGDPLVRYDGWSFHQVGDQYPFQILGADDIDVQPRVLTPSIMEALRGFFPFAVSESNFWLKFSLVRDGASLATLLSRVRASTYTIVGVETNHGEVFGSFTGSPWRVGNKWYGSGESFLWRLKRSRLTSQRNSNHSNFENKMEVYPFTGYDDLVQYCTTKTMAVGGGDWVNLPCPFDDEPKGIGFMVDGDLQVRTPNLDLFKRGFCSF